MKQRFFYVFIICFLMFILVGYGSGGHQLITPQRIKEFILGFGLLAPVIFIILFALTPFAPFFSAILAIGSGLIFGFFYGSMLVMIGATCSSTVGFYLARNFKALLLRRKNLEKPHELEIKLNKNGFLVVLFLRLVPLVPFDIVSYAAGFSRIRYKDYIIASLLGMFPGVLVYASIGAHAVNVYSKEFYFSLTGLVLLTLLAFVAKKRLFKQAGSQIEESATLNHSGYSASNS